MDQEILARLEGQLAAHQILLRMMMTALTRGDTSVSEFVETLRMETLSTFHHAQAPGTPYAKMVKQEAIEALDFAFDNLRARLGLSPRGA